MRCPTKDCGRVLYEIWSDFDFKECGLDNVKLFNWKALICNKCKIKLPILPSAEKLTPLIAKHLVFFKRLLRGEEITFLRKYLGCTPNGLAVRLGTCVDSRIINSWEVGSKRIDIVSDLRLRYFVVVCKLQKFGYSQIDILTLLLNGYAPNFDEDYWIELFEEDEEESKFNSRVWASGSKPLNG